MRMLMEFRPDLNITDNEDNTPLHCIGSRTVLEHIQLLVRAGASLDVQNKEGCTPLGIALRNSNDTVASYLIERRTNVNLASQTYGAPLHLACQNSPVAMVRRLVEAGADVDLAVQGAPGTPLQAAVLRRGIFDEEAKEIIRYLINEAGADVNRTGGTYGTVLAVAALQGSSTIVSFLLEKGADSGLADGMGRFPLHMAMLHELDNVKLIHNAGADLRARDRTGRSVLHWAAQGGSADVMHYVLELLSDNEDFDIDDKDNEGWTALCWAARGCITEFRTTGAEAQIEVIKLLLKRGAGLGVQARFSNIERWTPLKIAQYSGAPDEVLELLNPVTAKAGDDSHEEAKQRPAASVQRAVTKAFLHVDSYCTFCLGVSDDYISPDPCM
jgi:ankyrin repeat protein